jgi:hypothetical protein
VSLVPSHSQRSLLSIKLPARDQKLTVVDVGEEDFFYT